ncbi:MAG: hypothetical protein WA048_01070 [Minisyncoccia bacterium]
MPGLRQEVGTRYGVKLGERSEVAYDLTKDGNVVGRILVRMSTNGKTLEFAYRFERNGSKDEMLFAALIEVYSTLPELVQDIVKEGRGQSRPRPIRSLGVEPMEEIGKLFESFCKGDERVRALGTKEFIFEPEPYPRLGARQFWYVPESLFGAVLRKWKDQLDEYDSLHK